MCFVSYLMHQAFIQSDTVRIWRKKQLSFIQSKNMHLLQMQNDENQWDVYNSAADTDIYWSKYQSSLYISNNVLVRWDVNDPNI